MKLLRISYSKRDRYIALAVAFAMLFSGLPAPSAYAASNQLVVTPADTQTTVGAAAQVYSVKAYIDTSPASQTATGTLTFPANLLQASGAAVGSGWTGSPAINQSQGTVSFSLTRNSSATGFSTIFTVSFKPIGSGTAVAGFSGDSRINNTTTAYKSAIIRITNPNPTPSQPSNPKPPTPAKPSVAPVPIVTTTPAPSPEPSEAEPEPTPDPLGVVDNVLVAPQYNKAVVSWKVNATNSTSTLKYGTQPSVFDKEAAATRSDDGGYTTTISGLEPGKRYYFTVSGSGDGNRNGTYTGTILTNGFPVTLTITENNTPVKGAQIKIGTRTYSTTASGKASFGLAAGTYKASISTGTASKTVDLVVAQKPVPDGSAAPESQNFAYALTSSPLENGPGSSTAILTFLGVLVGGTVILAFGFLGFMAYRRKKFESGGSRSPSTTVIIDDGYTWHPDQAPPSAPTPPSAPPPSVMAPRHNNSVHIDEEEPLDMFEQNKQQKP